MGAHDPREALRPGAPVVRSPLAKAVKRAKTLTRTTRPSTFRQIIDALVTVAKGESTIPLPGVGMTKGVMATQVQAITRQQLARVPLSAKILGTAAVGTGAAAAVEIATGRSPARIIHDVARATARVPFQFSQGQRRQSMPHRGALRVGGGLPPSHQVVRTWQTFPGGPVFARLADGHIAVQKKDGTIKTFRPYRPVVIPRKWNARSMSRVATALKRQRKVATKILQITGGVPKRTVRVGGTHPMKGRDE